MSRLEKSWSHLMWILALTCVFCDSAWGGAAVRRAMGPGVTGALIDGDKLFLECRPPLGPSAEAYLGQYLANPADWKVYSGRQAVAIRFANLKPSVQRQLLLAVYPNDYVDGRGWWHILLSDSIAELRTFCLWTTGSSTNSKHALRDKNNRRRILVPSSVLREEFRHANQIALPELEPLERPAAPAPAAPVATNGDAEPVDLDAAARELTYGRDARGEYAMYRLKSGEALYTAVVVRFTDYQEADSTLRACEVIRERSGIKDVRSMQAGQKILIPVDMLSARFAPKGSERRVEFEKTIKETKRLRSERRHTRDLDGVVVILDAGHGGRDNGAQNAKCGLYEDEINYDIMCRVKRILEAKTQAKVYTTIEDCHQGYEPSDCRTFTCGGKEQLLTTPRYDNQDAKVSANLRWYLANSYYRKELARGTNSRQIVFTSFHTDALFNSSMRGAMIYIPGASLRNGYEQPSASVYAKFAEVRQQNPSKSTAAERRRDEALSRSFADELMEAFGKRRIRRHLEGDWIRNQIRRNGKSYVPAVLRNTMVPTKVLIEVANMTNPTDCSRLADPEWRQLFAEAYVDALKAHFGS